MVFRQLYGSNVRYSVDYIKELFCRMPEPNLTVRKLKEGRTRNTTSNLGEWLSEATYACGVQRGGGGAGEGVESFFN